MSLPSTTCFLLGGDLAAPGPVSVGELRERWPRRRADVVFRCARSGPRRHVFEGPLLRDVVAAAGPAFGPEGRRSRARFVLAVSGGDGHRAVLSWAEVDAEFGDVPVLLATSLDGRPLDAEGSQLVVPSDRCGARYVSAVTDVWFARWPFSGVGQRDLGGLDERDDAGPGGEPQLPGGLAGDGRRELRALDGHLHG